MKSLLTIPLSVDLEVVIEKGQKVKTGDIIAKKKAQSRREKIPLSKILSIKPSKMTSYLVKKIGTHVKKGEVLAKKEGIFKSIRIISPLSALIESIDLKDGSILLVTKEVAQIFEYAPMSGFIEGIDEDGITISFEGKVIEAEQGKGDQIIGSAVVFSHSLDMLHFASEVKNKIVIAFSVSDGARAKLSALGARGIVALEYYEDFPVVLKLSQKEFRELVRESNKQLILLGEKRRILIPVA